MQLQAGFSLVTAPRFPPLSVWADRLCLNGGIEREGTRVHPRPDWRRPTAEELALLVREKPQREPSLHPVSLGENSETAGPLDHGEHRLRPREAGLLAIPEWLREAWWASAGRSAQLAERIAGYQRFVAAVLEFLRFKRLPLPAQCEADVTASRPDLKGTRLDPETGELSGLALAAAGPRHTVGVINLGDEATHLVLLNLPSQLMRALLAGASEPDPWSLPPAQLAARFFAARPDYPLTRVRLDPRDGLWFPRADIIYDGWAGAKRDVDVVLTIRGELEETASSVEPGGGYGPEMFGTSLPPGLLSPAEAGSDIRDACVETMREPPPAAPPGAWP